MICHIGITSRLLALIFPLKLFKNFNIVPLEVSLKLKASDLMQG